MKNFLTNKFTIITILLLLAVSLPITIWQVQRSQDLRQRASEGSTITANLSPATGSYPTGANFSVDLNVTATNDVGSAQFTVLYDPALLTLLSITPASPYTTATETSDSGSKTITLLNITTSQVIGQNVKIATIQFSPISAGSTTVSIKNPKFTASGGTVTVDPASVLSATYTIGAGPTCTPKPACLDEEPACLPPVPPGGWCGDLTPTPTCTPRPACLDTNPSCNLPEPIGGWCPGANPTPTCSPRPACLDTEPRCLLSDPQGGWCPAPTGSTQSGDTKLNLSFTLSGIGNSATSSQQLNNNPTRTTRTGDVIVLDRNLNVVDTYSLSANYNSQNGVYNATANLGDLPSGTYFIKFRLDNTLFKSIPGGMDLIGGTTNSHSGILELISGDVVRTGTSDNVIDILDYSAVHTCLDAIVSNVSVQAVGAACGLQTALKTDFNDDDVIDLKDYNIILRAFTKRVGD